MCSFEVNYRALSILRVTACVACHATDPKVWRKAKGMAKAPTDELHKKAIGAILKKSAK